MLTCTSTGVTRTFLSFLSRTLISSICWWRIIADSGPFPYTPTACYTTRIIIPPISPITMNCKYIQIILGFEILFKYFYCLISLVNLIQNSPGHSLVLQSIVWYASPGQWGASSEASFVNAVQSRSRVLLPPPQVLEHDP